jgi:rsbT antagonist protein RsbS
MNSGIPVQLHEQCLIASIQVDLSHSLLDQFRQEMLQRIVEQGNIRGVVFDLSGLQIIDLPDFEEIVRIIDMIRLMGYRTIISGLRPEVISSLVMLDADIDGLVGVAGLDEALEKINEMNGV